MQRFGTTFVAAVIALGPAGGAIAQDLTFFRIASGSVGGTYFPIAGLVAAAVSDGPGAEPCAADGACGVPGLVAVAQTSTGSLANVAAVQAGRVESGFAAADVVHAAHAGTGAFAEQAPHDALRVVANLFPEHLQLVLPAGAALDSLADLAGKRVGIGQAGSGTRALVLELLALHGLGRGDIEEAELDNARSAARLAAGELDAYFYVAGTPTAAMAELAVTHGIELYRFAPAEIDALVGAVPAYRAAAIPAGTYAGVDYDVPTVAVGAQWVTSSEQPEALIYAITAALWSDATREVLDEGHPKGADITLETALDGVTIPLHPGAARFYAEAGLLEP